jgi:hypothetical protein
MNKGRFAERKKIGIIFNWGISFSSLPAYN